MLLTIQECHDYSSLYFARHTVHLEVGVSLIVMMTPMHGENPLKKQTTHKIFYFNLESKNLSMHWRHHLANSRQSPSAQQPFENYSGLLLVVLD